MMTDPGNELLNALEDERRYVARELHDGLAQTTLQLGLQAGICRKLLEHNKLDMLATELARLEECIQIASGQVREIIADMRPPKVEPDAALNDYLQQVIETHLERGGPPVAYEVRWTGEPPMSARQRLGLARGVQEALLNIRKHTEAKEIHLRLAQDEDNFYVTISDDGHGFDPEEVRAQPTDKGGAGLANLRARTEAIGGRLTIDSGIQGTSVLFTLPK